jgi:hypothetical protein
MDKIKVLENFIDDADCDLAVKLYEDTREKGLYRNTGDGRLLNVNPTFPDAVYLANKYVSKLETVYGTKFYAREVFMSLYQTSSSIDPHFDYSHPDLKNSLGIMLYFNDDFEGGELYFPKYNYEYKPVRGSAIVFPCNDEEYLHGVRSITSGCRYTMPIEVTENERLKSLVTYT